MRFQVVIKEGTVGAPRKMLAGIDISSTTAPFPALDANPHTFGLGHERLRVGELQSGIG